MDSISQTRIALVAPWAVKYGLDPLLTCAVCEQESQWQPFAVRFEPGFYTKYVSPQKLTDVTEAYCRAMSFGLMQIMGQTAREFGYQDKYLTQLCQSELGLEFGCKKLRACFDKHNNDNETALLAYNGGINLEYAAEVLARVPHYMGAS